MSDITALGAYPGEIFARICSKFWTTLSSRFRGGMCPPMRQPPFIYI